MVRATAAAAARRERAGGAAGSVRRWPAGTGDLVVPAGGTRTLRYCALLHGAGWDAARLEAARRAFAAP